MVSPKNIYHELAPEFYIVRWFKVVAQNLDKDIMVSPKNIYHELAPGFYVVRLLLLLLGKTVIEGKRFYRVLRIEISFSIYLSRL